MNHVVNDQVCIGPAILLQLNGGNEFFALANFPRNEIHNFYFAAGKSLQNEKKTRRKTDIGGRVWHWWERYKWVFYRSSLFLNSFNLQSGCQNQIQKFFNKIISVVVVRAAVNNITQNMHVRVSTIQFVRCRRIMKAWKDNKINGKYKRNLYRVFHERRLWICMSRFRFVQLKLLVVNQLFLYHHLVQFEFVRTSRFDSLFKHFMTSAWL